MEKRLIIDKFCMKYALYLTVNKHDDERTFHFISISFWRHRKLC